MSGAGSAVRVAFQGELGAFSEEAARRFFSGPIEPVPCREFREVGAAVAGGSVAYGLLPIENTLAGSVVASYDVLGTEPLEVVGEVIVPIHHCLLGVPRATLEGVTRVLSHPVALAQCSRFLIEHPAIEAVAVYDTAGAARDVARAGDRAVAAIAGQAAAQRYGLDILMSNIEDRPDNQTRFLVVARAGNAPPAEAARAEGQKKTALLVETDNTPGSLVQALLPFANRGINLSKLESRPGAAPWTYRFFMELEADAEAPDTQEALAEVRRRASALRILGSFIRWV